jgi:hypothetical protein
MVNYFPPPTNDKRTLLLLFWDRVLILGSHWPQNSFLLPQLSKCWDYRCVPPCSPILIWIFFPFVFSFLAVLGFELRPYACKHSTIWTTLLALFALAVFHIGSCTFAQVWPQTLIPLPIPAADLGLQVFPNNPCLIFVVAVCLFHFWWYLLEGIICWDGTC